MHTRRQFLAATGSLLARFATIPAMPFSSASGADDTNEIDLVLEHAFLIAELRFFEREYLPVLCHQPYATSKSPWPNSWPEKSLLEEWQAAARRLAHGSLNMQDFHRRLKNAQPGTPKSSQLGPVKRDEFAPLFRSCYFNLEYTSRRDIIVNNGRINWQIYPVFNADYEKDVRGLLSKALPSVTPSDNPRRAIAQKFADA